MIFQILLLVLGFVILIKGADWLVDGASALARKFRVSDLAIGLTVVAFGTSMPELVVNVFASAKGEADIVFGNIIGSNNFNLFAILGITGLISPLIVQSSTVWKEIPLSLVAAMILFLLSNSFFGQEAILSRADSIMLLLFFSFFLFYVFKQLKTDLTQQDVKHKELPVVKIWLYIIAGLAFLVLGGRLVVVNSVQLAELLGISKTIIGLTIVAAGTSLPELATSVVAAVKKNNDIAVGNIIGSNIFNIFFILGISSLIKPVAFDPKFNTDLYLLGAGTVVLFIAMFSGGKRKLDRWEAGLLLGVYVAYTFYLVRSAMQ